MTDNSDRARRRPTIVVRRGNVRSSKLRGGDVRCGKVRYWGHGAATFGTAKRGAMYGAGAEKWGAGATTGRCASASVMKAGRMKATAPMAIGRMTTNPIGDMRSLFTSPVQIGSAGREDQPVARGARLRCGFGGA